ncbi:DUF2933 domain-containing protein [Cupriavidus necator]|uniref:DUF2933 domain-containing protein n=1 Tax=Cupriavidus necator TaxID=106590 RepID=UPI00339D91F7
MENGHRQSSSGVNAGRLSRFPLLLLSSAIAMAAIALAMRHWNLVAAWLPFALVLLCPLMHLFHGGHGRNASSGNANDAVDGQRND